MSTVTDTPVEVRVAAGTLAGGAALFLLVGLVRWLTEGGFDVVGLPLVVFLAAGSSAAGLFTGRIGLRIFAMVIASLTALLYLQFVLSDGFWWVRVLGGLAAAGAVYAVVLLNTGPARQFFGLEAPGRS
ncbi:hypothetical protein [Actinoalloteichus hymeniacidonis]|uniref:Uncharacterized protein n=1 Tax=Actinoalloteichus hymeniacidonis TaxID=340345 RepID=A0AAC9HQK2_9PSEU|nr:hypothetical protein [Actinoalloteichus hymeniacidonis]AOS62765.1 hypothetical protein TL08_09750 [Actinoalloteichus hymeniacidonis]MBB5909204.1 hypothetical protein [Actinoalloteichus hymeniacidonis]